MEVQPPEPVTVPPQDNGAAPTQAVGVADPGPAPAQPANAPSPWPAVLPGAHNGPRSGTRRVSKDARSAVVPAILFGATTLVAIGAFVVVVVGLVGLGSSQFSVTTSWTADQCQTEARNVAAAVSAYSLNSGQVPTASALVSAGLLDRVPVAYRVTSTGDVVPRTPGPCQGGGGDQIDAVPAATLSAVGVGLLVLFAAPLLLMWWLYRAFRSLPQGRRHFSALWAFGPLFWTATVLAEWVLIYEMVDQTQSGNTIDSLSLLSLLVVCWFLSFYLYAGIVRRIGSMFEALGGHFAETNWPGRIIRAYGSVLMLAVPVYVLVLLAHVNGNEGFLKATAVLLLVWYAVLLLLYLGTIVAVLCGVIIITIGQHRAMAEHAAQMTEDRLEHIERDRARAESLAGLHNVPLTGSAYRTR